MTCVGGIWSYFAVSAVDNSRRRVKLAQRECREVHGTATNLQRKHRDKSRLLDNSERGLDKTSSRKRSTKRQKGQQYDINHSRARKLYCLNGKSGYRRQVKYNVDLKTTKN